MEENKYIQLRLFEGNLTGRIRAELSKWMGVLFISPRESYEMFSNQPEINHTGIYMLLSEEKVYIGQAGDLLKRIKEHDNPTFGKEWWNRVVILSDKTNQLNRNSIDYLENKFIDKAKDAGALYIDNKKNGNNFKVNLYEEVPLNDYIEGALLLIELVGINVFKNKKVSNKNKKSEQQVKDPIFIPSDTVFDDIIIDKKKAMELFNNKGTLKNNEFLTYSKLNEEKKYFWANSNPDCLEKNWFIILNDIIEKKLYLLNIPSNTLILATEAEKGLKIRKDKNLLDLKINYRGFVEINSGIPFDKFIIDISKY